MTSTLPLSRAATGLAIVRIAVGVIFLMHGWQKVFTYGFAGVSGSFADMGVPMPGVMGPFIALLELVGGLALILGVLTRVFAALLAFDMLGAFFLVHMAGGFFLPAGFEFVFILFAATLALALCGPGAWSVDDRMGARGTAVG